VNTYRVNDSNGVVGELGHSILQIGTIFKTICVYESLLALCTDEGLHFAELTTDMKIKQKP